MYPHAVPLNFHLYRVQVCMYTQELMRAEGLKERPTQFFFLLLTVDIINILTGVIIYIQ